MKIPHWLNQAHAICEYESFIYHPPIYKYVYNILLLYSFGYEKFCPRHPCVCVYDLIVLHSRTYHKRKALAVCAMRNKACARYTELRDGHHNVEHDAL